MDITGADIVLGVAWLRSLGRVLTDFQHLTMEFLYEGSPRILYVENLLRPLPLNAKCMQKLLLHSDFKTLYQFQLSHSPENHHLSDLPPPILELLNQFESVFKEPCGLPPHRELEHQIDLLPESKPVHVKPYKYPHLQKAEIERLVKEMLSNGIIRDSKSSFSSPVLLVKKKDDSWRFCIDYRALNKLTIRDLYPMPTMEEILDDLQGASIFSKIDLKSGYYQIRMKDYDIHKKLLGDTLVILSF